MLKKNENQINNLYDKILVTGNECEVVYVMSRDIVLVLFILGMDLGAYAAISQLCRAGDDGKTSEMTDG